MSKTLFRAMVGLLLVLLGGCSLQHHAGDLARVSPGDHKSIVLYRLGTPSAAESKGQAEVLYYDLLNKNGATDEYYVKLVGSYVDSYGKVGDQPAAPGN